jgi:hypothetical protein
MASPAEDLADSIKSSAEKKVGGKAGRTYTRTTSSSPHQAPPNPTQVELHYLTQSVKLFLRRSLVAQPSLATSNPAPHAALAYSTARQATNPTDGWTAPGGGAQNISGD